MKKRISVLLFAAALTLGLTCGRTAIAQPGQPCEHFPGNHTPSPDVKEPTGENFKRPDGQHLGQETRDSFLQARPGAHRGDPDFDQHRN